MRVQEIPGNPFRLLLSYGEKEITGKTLKSIPGFLPEDNTGESKTATIPTSQIRELIEAIDGNGIQMEYDDASREHMKNPAADIVIDKVDEDTLSINGDIDDGKGENGIGRITKRVTGTCYHLPIQYNITGRKMAERTIRKKYGKNSYQPRVKTTDDARKAIDSFKDRMEQYRTGKNIKKGKIHDITLKRDLRRYQETAVDFLEARQGKGAICDDMGLGKTTAAIAYPEVINAQRILVVCPSNMKYTWEEEIHKVIENPGRIKVLEGKKPTRQTETYIDGNERWVIINYDILQTRIHEIQTHMWDVIILDESHYIKNYDSKRSLAVRNLYAKNRICLTGTPIPNRPDEFWTTFSWLDPDEWGNDRTAYREFTERYGQRNGDTLEKSEKLMELNQRTKHMMIRRKKDEVEDLPEKTRQIRYISLTNEQMRAYREKEKEIWPQIEPYLNDINTKLGENSQQHIFMILQTLRRQASLFKIPLTMEIIHEALNSENKIVVFSEFLGVLDTIEQHLKKEKHKTYRVDGNVRKKDRYHQVNEFQGYNGPAVFLAQIRAAGVGITLHSASIAVFNDFAWNAATHRQAEDRIHRIGQKKSCHYIYVSAKGTVDEDIIDLLLRKIEVISVVMDEEEQMKGMLDNISQRMRRT